MFQKWKESGIAAPGRGRPLKVQISEAEKEVSKVLRSRSTDSSAFMLGNMKNIFTNKIKEQVAKDGLGPESVTSGCSDELAKAMLTAVAMGEETGKLTNQSLLVKTEKMFQAEHSIFSAYANALTYLSTHFIEGPMPSNLPQFKVDKLDSRAIETIELTKIALEADNVYPVIPNLVTSCDDSTNFVIEGVQGGTGDWEWKIVDTVNTDSSVRIDFKVQGKNEISGGLRIRPTFTLSASGLSAPPYITVSGLSKEEQCPIFCPGGICTCS